MTECFDCIRRNYAIAICKIINRLSYQILFYEMYEIDT
jgi:hypothetical protein